MIKPESITKTKPTQKIPTRIIQYAMLRLIYLHAKIQQYNIRIKARCGDEVSDFILNASAGTAYSGMQITAKFSILEKLLREFYKKGKLYFATFTIPQRKITAQKSWEILAHSLQGSIKVILQKYKRLGFNIDYLKDLEAHLRGGCHAHVVFMFDTKMKKQDIQNFISDVKSDYQDRVNEYFTSLKIEKYHNNFQIDFKKATSEKIAHYLLKEVSKYRNMQAIINRPEFKELFSGLEKRYEAMGNSKTTKSFLISLVAESMKCGTLSDYDIKCINTHFFAILEKKRVFEISRVLQKYVKVFQSDSGKMDTEAVRLFNEGYDPSVSYDENINFVIEQKEFDFSDVDMSDSPLDSIRDKSHTEKTDFEIIFVNQTLKTYQYDEEPPPDWIPIDAENYKYRLLEYNLSNAMREVSMLRKEYQLQSLIDISQSASKDLYFSGERFDKRKQPSLRNDIFNYIEFVHGKRS